MKVSKSAFEICLTETAISENQFSFHLCELHNDPFKPTAELDHPFLSSSFCTALAALYYHLEYGSRILILSAESGLGKTTLLRHLERRVRDRCRTLVVSPTHNKGSEVLRKLMIAIGGGAASRDFVPIQEQVDEILTTLVRTESPFVLFLDLDEEAQDCALETLSRLVRLQAIKKGLLRVVIAGYPDLAEQLKDSELADEIVPLSPLLATEVETYIDHRLQQAGWRGGPLFSANAFESIAERSCGKPSSINEICSELLQNLTQCSDDSADADRNLENILDESYVEPVLSGWKFGNATFPDSASHSLESRRSEISKTVQLQIVAPSARPLKKRRAVAPAYIVLMLVVTCAGLWYRKSVKAGSATHVSTSATWHDPVFHDKPSRHLSKVARAITTALNSEAPSAERLLKKDQKPSSRPFSTISGSALVLPQRLILLTPPESSRR